MHRPCVIILGVETALTTAAAEALGDAGIDVHSLALCEEALHEVKTLLPDVVVAPDTLSDADLLRVSRNLRGNVAAQHLAALILVAALDPQESANGHSAPGHSASGNGNGAAGSPTTIADHERRSGVELAATLRQWVRTADSVRASRDVIRHDRLSIDRRRFSVTVDEHEVSMTTTEFRLLWVLARGAGRVFSRAELYESCGAHDAAVNERTVDVHVRSIRKKLGHCGHFVETVRGVGYRFCPTPPSRSLVLDRAS